MVKHNNNMSCFSTRLSKISWYVSVLFKNNWILRHKQIMILCKNRLQELFYYSITKFDFIYKSLSDSSLKRSAIFHTTAWLQLRVSRTLFATKHINIKTVLRMSRPFLRRSRSGSRQIKRMEKNVLNDNIQLHLDNNNFQKSLSERKPPEL